MIFCRSFLHYIVLLLYVCVDYYIYMAGSRLVLLFITKLCIYCKIMSYEKLPHLLFHSYKIWLKAFDEFCYELWFNIVTLVTLATLLLVPKFSLYRRHRCQISLYLPSAISLLLQRHPNLQKHFCQFLSQFHDFLFPVLLLPHLHLKFLFFSFHHTVIKLVSSPSSLLSACHPLSLLLFLQQSKGYFYPECHCSARAHTSLTQASALGSTLLRHTYTHILTEAQMHACRHAAHINAKWRRPL